MSCGYWRLHQPVALPDLNFDGPKGENDFEALDIIYYKNCKLKHVMRKTCVSIVL